MKRYLPYFYTIGLLLNLVSCQLFNQIESRVTKVLNPSEVISDNTELMIFEDSSKWSSTFGYIVDDFNFTKMELKQSGKNGMIWV
jgi:hypothetical protein